VGNDRYTLTWLRALMTVEKPVRYRLRELARVFLPIMKSLENPKLLELCVSDLEVPKIRPTDSF
jgi:hypothetical protein